MANFRFNLNIAPQNITLNNVNQKRKTIGNLLIYACFFMYMTSMSVKGIVAAETAYIKEMWSLSYTQTSLANAFYFVIYGLVQIGMFIFMKKINMRKFLLFTIPISAVCAILMGTSKNIVQLWAYFGLTGAFQAGVFAGCNSTLTACLPNELLSKGNKFMNLGYAFGTVLAYAVCGLCVSNDLWRVPFYIFGILFIISFVIFMFISGFAWKVKRINEIFVGSNKPLVEEKVIEAEENPILSLDSKKKLVIFYAIDLTIIFIITSLYYCIMNNVTLLLKNVHNLGNDVSIYVSILAPITIAIGPIMTISSCNKDRNFIRQALKFMFIVLPIPLLLMFFYDLNVILALALTIIFVVLTNGVKAIAISVITFNMRKQINAGAYCAISNAIASIAAGVMPVLIGKVIDIGGWEVSYLVTFIVALLLTTAIFVINLFVTKADNRRQELKK